MISKNIDILFIDCDSAFIKQAEKFFQQFEINVYCTTEMSIGLQVMEEARPHIVVTGRKKPHFIGEDVAIRFSELIMFKESFVYLVLSEEVNTKDMFSLLTLGFEDIFHRSSFEDKMKKIICKKCLKGNVTKAA